MITATGLTRHYQMGDSTVLALDGISFHIAAGEFTAIVGPSGSGKSTLMNLLGALDRPTSGTYILDGQPLQNLSPNQLAAVRNQAIGFVFQTFHLLPRLTALENVELPLIYRGTSARQRRETAREFLTKVGLADRADHLPNQLSGGQRQRVAIARALVGRPAILLADEPTGALDSHTGGEILDLFQGLFEEGRTVLVITHDPKVARRTNRVIQLADGKIIWDGPVREWQS